MDKKNRSGRGPNIPSNVKKLIAQIYVENRDQTAKEVMTELHKQLKKDWGQDWPPGWPGISAVQKELEKFRNKSEDIDDEDKPWGHIALSAYPLPPNTIPIVYRVWGSSMRKDKPLTIRQAKWASYLSHIYIKKNNINEKAIEELRTTACAAASREKVLKLTGGLPAKYDDMLWYWLEDAHLYSVLTGDGSLMNKINDEYGAKEETDQSQDADTGDDAGGTIEWSPVESAKKHLA
jgi:hypothetical protein